MIFTISCSKDDSQNDTQEQFCGIYVGNIKLRTMIEIEEFAKCNYSEITGDLSIFDGNIAYPITDLSELSSLTKVGGHLGIGNLNVLTNLKGLHNITSARLLLLGGNKVLSNLDDLDNLQTGYIEINNNPALQNINGLDMDSDEMTTIAIYNCPSLTNLNCFFNIKTITSALIIENNFGLKNLQGLQNLETIGTNYSADCCGSFQLEDNYNLESINELNNLTYIKGGTVIHNNYSLLHIDGLSNVTKIEGDLNIRYNFFLNHLNGLQNVDELEGEINIYDNPSLRNFCGLQNLFTSNGHTGSYLIFGNYNNPQHNQIINTQCE